MRVDNRLVHGQVLEAWLPALSAQGILVADDEAAGSPLAKGAMALAIPPRVSFQVMRLEEAAGLLRDGGKGTQSARTLVLLRDIAAAVALRDGGVRMPKLNVGNVHFGAGRRAVTGSVFLNEGEVVALERLSASGTEVELRAVPAEAPVVFPQIRSRFDSAVV